jgi:hypothetical protein
MNGYLRFKKHKCCININFKFKNILIELKYKYLILYTFSQCNFLIICKFYFTIYQCVDLLKVLHSYTYNILIVILC